MTRSDIITVRFGETQIWTHFRNRKSIFLLAVFWHPSFFIADITCGSPLIEQTLHRGESFRSRSPSASELRPSFHFIAGRYQMCAIGAGFGQGWVNHARQIPRNTPQSQALPASGLHAETVDWGGGAKELCALREICDPVSAQMLNSLVREKHCLGAYSSYPAIEKLSLLFCISLVRVTVKLSCLEMWSLSTSCYSRNTKWAAVLSRAILDMSFDWLSTQSGASSFGP